MIYLELFLAFLRVGTFSIGGGYAAIPLIQSLAVQEYGWLTPDQFSNLITIAEMTPGPIAVNSATFVGIQTAGISGAIIATFGCIFPSCIIVSLLAWIYFRFKNMDTMQNILSFVRPAVVALIASAGVSIFLSALSCEIPLAQIVLFLLCFLCIHYKKTNPILTMTACGILYVVVSLIFTVI